MKIIINLLVNALAVFITAYILPGVHVRDFGTAIVVAVVLGLVNSILKPILVFLTLPLTIITLGLFQFILNALLIMLVSNLVPGFTVSGLFWAMLFSLVLSLVSWAIRATAEK